ncbi:hypothetical protein ACTHFI_005033 [Klebsiella oxytoca]
MTTDITELAQSKALHKKLNRRLNDALGFQRTSGGKHTTISLSIDECKSVLSDLDERFALVEALEKAQRRNAELEAQNDYFASLVAMARISADKAIRKFPQPNYVLLKVAEEAGEVVQAGVHYAENRMEWGQVEGEIVQLLAMLIRLVTEGDQVNGITPPASYCAGIKWEAE